MIYEGSRYAGHYNYIDDIHLNQYISFKETHIKNTKEDVMYQFKSGDRLDLIANEFYGNPQLGWKILYANAQYMTEFDIEIGDTLAIPMYDPERENLWI